MAGFLRFVAWFALLVGAFVLVVLPLLLSPLLSQMVRDMGVRAQTLEVSVAMFDPGLLFGRSKRVTVAAGNVDVSVANIGHFEISLGDASYFDRSFESIEGDLRDVSVTIGGDTFTAASISVDGPADAASATARLAAPEVERLVLLAASRVGLTVDAVRVSDSGVSVTVRGLEADARVTVRGGALLLQPGFGGAVVLLQPAPSDPWSLSEAWISDQGLNVSAVVNVRRIVRDLDAARVAGEATT